jgi:hypothetical protein
VESPNRTRVIGAPGPRFRPRSLEDLAGAPISVHPGSALVVGQATQAAPLTGAAAFAWGRSLAGSSGPFLFVQHVRVGNDFPVPYLLWHKADEVCRACDVANDPKQTCFR